MADSRRGGTLPGLDGVGDYIIALLVGLVLWISFFFLYYFSREIIERTMASSGYEPEQPLDKELTRVMKDTEKDLKEARKALAVLNKLHAKLKPPKITANMGFVSKSIYEKNPTIQTDIFSRLPAELQRMIWSYLVLQPDRIAFALTCKWNAEMQARHKADYDKIALKSIQKQHRLAVLIRLSNWVPSGYRLCFECVRFCAKITKGDWGGDTAMVDEKYTEAGRVIKNALVRGPRCPGCRHIRGVDHLNHKSTVKEHKAILRKHVGPLN